MSQGLHQSSSSNTSGQRLPRRTFLSSRLLVSDWNPSWLPIVVFASPSITPPRPFVKIYSPSSWPGITFYQLPRPDSHVASDVVLCVIESMFFARPHQFLEWTWRTVYARCLKTFRLRSRWTLIIQTEASAFLSLDGFSLFMRLLLDTPSRYIALEVFNANALQSFVSPTSCITPPKWRRLVIKRVIQQPSNTSDVRSTTPHLRLSFSAHDQTSTLCLYLDESNSSTGSIEPIMTIIDRLLSLDAMILLDDLDVKKTYASLVVRLLPALLGEQRLLRLQGLPVVHSVTRALLSLGVKLPAALILDFSSPDAIKTFVYWLPRILTSITEERCAQPLDVYLCFNCDAVLSTEDPTLWENINDILAADHRLARLSITSLDAIDDGLESHLKVRLKVLIPTAAGTYV